MSKQRSILVLLLISSGAVTAPADDVRSARALARDGDLQGDWNKLLDARARLLLLGDAPQAHFVAGYVEWRLSSLAYLALGPQGAVPLLERSARQLSSAAAHSDGAEAHALHAAVLTFLLGADPRRAPELGPKARAAWAAAEKLGADNPRVILLRAMTTFFTPAQYGGGVERGLLLWLDAIARFGRAPPSDPGEWGEAEAWGWLGGAYSSIGRQAEAREAFGRALALRPDFWWVSRIALPQARRPATE